MKACPVVIAVIAMLVAAATSWASLADEQRPGHDLAAQLQSGAKSCRELSGDVFDHLGEYVMAGRWAPPPSIGR